MNLKQPLHERSCLIDSFAMVANCYAEEIVEFIGYDGREQDVCITHVMAFMLSRGIAVTPLYELTHQEGSVYCTDALFINRAMRLYDGVVCYNSHAVAWCSNTLTYYDPRGSLFQVRPVIECFFLCSPLPRSISYTCLISSQKTKS